MKCNQDCQQGRRCDCDDDMYEIERWMAWGKANAEAEREVCAVICEKMRHPWGHSAETQDWVGATEHCAAAIRARGTK